jgi:hypothetical protein
MARNVCVCVCVCVCVHACIHTYVYTYVSVITWKKIFFLSSIHIKILDLFLILPMKHNNIYFLGLHYICFYNVFKKIQFHHQIY